MTIKIITDPAEADLLYRAGLLYVNGTDWEEDSYTCEEDCPSNFPGLLEKHVFGINVEE